MSSDNGGAIYCNARKRGNKDRLELREPGEHEGEGYCKQPTGGGRCRFHGGETVPAGPAHHSYKHGRYSKHVPNNLKQKFLDALDDEEYLSLRSEIGLVSSRIAEVLERINTEESIDKLKPVSEAYESVRNAYDRGDAEALAEALDDLGRRVTSWEDAQESWGELRELLDLRKDLVGEERRQAEFLAQMVHRDQFITVMDRLASSISSSLEEHVEDPEARDEVLRDVTRQIQETFD